MGSVDYATRLGYRVRLNGRLIGDYPTFDDAHASLDREASRASGDSVGAIIGPGRAALYRLKKECTDSGSMAHVWREIQ